MKIKDLFDYKYGVNLELINCQETGNNDNNSVNFVARTSNNNGVVSRVKLIDNLEPQKAGTLSLAVSGSVLSCFVQNENYYSGRDLYVLTPKIDLTLEQKLFYAMCINKNKYRYSYGRAANKTFPEIEIPELDICNNFIQQQKAKTVTTHIKENKLLINTNSWKEFKLSTIFQMDRGRRLTKEDREIGTIPFVTAGYENYGVVSYVANAEQKSYYNAITIDMFGNSFYYEREFKCDDNVLVLSNDNLNKYNSIFISTILRKDKYKNSYGRQYRQKDFINHIIKLPVKDSEPDWEYMENYIKSLPYGDRI